MEYGFEADRGKETHRAQHSQEAGLVCALWRRPVNPYRKRSGKGGQPIIINCCPIHPKRLSVTFSCGPRKIEMARCKVWDLSTTSAKQVERRCKTLVLCVTDWHYTNKLRGEYLVCQQRKWMWSQSVFAYRIHTDPRVRSGIKVCFSHCFLKFLCKTQAAPELYIYMRKGNASVFVLCVPQQSHCADPACSQAPVKRNAVQGEPRQTKVAT